MKLIETVERCCPQVRDGALGQKDAERVAAAFRVIADPARLRLLSLLGAQPDCGACVCDLAAPLRLTQPTISHHLKILHDAGFLSRERRGTWVYYKLIPRAMAVLRDALSGATSGAH